MRDTEKEDNPLCARFCVPLVLSRARALPCFIDFKKAFDRVWDSALWATIKTYNISVNLIRVTKNLYDMVTIAVLFNGSIGDLFRTTVGVRQGCLLSPTLFNIFPERITTDALENHECTLNIEGRIIINLRFADDIDG